MIKVLLQCKPARLQQWQALRFSPIGCQVTGARKVSINTAISSGIRRSQGAGPSRERNRRFADRDLPGTSSFGRDERSPRRREARPNHAGKQDFEDARESASRALATPNVRQRAYLRGGRPEESSRPYDRIPNRTRGSFDKTSLGGESSRWAGSGQASDDRKPSSFRNRREINSPSSFRSSSSESGYRSRSYDGGRSSSMSSADQLEEKYGRERKSRTGSENFSSRERFQSREPQRREERSSFHRSEYRGSDTKRPSRFDRPQSRYDNNDDSTQILQKPKRNDDPVSIPYTTPASEFLYGTSVVTAALKASRRKLYKLYVYEGENRERTQQDNVMIRLARNVNVPVQSLSGDGIRMMDKMSTGRPHNGYILESSPLPKAPTTSLLAQSSLNDSFEFTSDYQSREEAAVNGNQSSLPNTSGEGRHPLVILIDGVLDPGNLGAILRTSHFLGVSAICLPTRTTAPLSAVALKASAGSSEFIPLLTIREVLPFIDNCKTNGWRVYAASAPKADPSKAGKFIATTKVGNALKETPCLLMLGGEGEGLRGILKKKADFEVGIRGRRASEGDIESLNVSVATGLLVDSFLREEWKGKRSREEIKSKTEKLF